MFQPNPFHPVFPTPVALQSCRAFLALPLRTVSFISFAHDSAWQSARTEKCIKSEDTPAAWPQIILLLLVEELTIEENWAISVAASCTVLSDR